MTDPRRPEHRGVTIWTERDCLMLRVTPSGLIRVERHDTGEVSDGW